MKNKLYQEIRNGNKKPCGVYGLSNYGGLAIYEIISGIDDKAVSGFDFGNVVEDLKTTKIFYTVSGRAYIRRYNTRYYFDNILRV